MDFPIRLMTKEHRHAWLALRLALWPHTPEAVHRQEIALYLAHPETMAGFIVFTGDHPAGFIEVAIRSYAEGCPLGDVGHIEGWYVVPQHRNNGYGSALVAAAETWVEGKGYRYIASDTEMTNIGSITAHARLGYQEINRLVHFVKKLS